MATLVRWEPMRELATLQSEMSRLMNGLLDTDARTRQDWVPAVDVWETDSEVVYAFDLPGIAESDISVELEEGALTVSGKRERTEKVDGDRFYRYERRFGTFTRTIGLPQGIGEEAVHADYKDGVLEVHVAKPEQPKPRKIQIGGGDKRTIEGSAKKS